MCEVVLVGEDEERAEEAEYDENFVILYINRFKGVTLFGLIYYLLF